MERITHNVTLNTNVQTSQYTSKQADEAKRSDQNAPLLPSGTPISEQIKQVFNFTSAEADLLKLLEAACPNPTLRTANGFHDALNNTLHNLKALDSDNARKSQSIIEQLLMDKQLLDWYRSMLVDN